MNGMRLSIVGTLQRGMDASERSFLLAQQRRTIEAQAKQTQQAIDALKSTQEAQEAQVELMTAAIDSMNGLLQLQTEADADLRAMLEAESNETQKLQREAAEAQTKALERIAAIEKEQTAKLTELKKQLAAWLPTGTIIWSVKPLDAHYWLYCNGREVPKERYPALAKLVGDTFGSPSSSDKFKLPSKSQLTAASFMLNNNRMKPFIHT